MRPPRRQPQRYTRYCRLIQRRVWSEGGRYFHHFSRYNTRPPTRPGAMTWGIGIISTISPGWQYFEPTKILFTVDLFGSGSPLSPMGRRSLLPAQPSYKAIEPPYSKVRCADRGLPRNLAVLAPSPAGVLVLERPDQAARNCVARDLVKDMGWAVGGGGLLYLLSIRDPHRAIGHLVKVDRRTPWPWRMHLGRP